MKHFHYLTILTICIVAVLAVFSLKFLLPGTDSDIPKVEIAQGIDGEKYINVTVTLPQIKNEIAPIIIDDFLSQTKIAKADSGGLELVDFKDNSVLARYGFERGDIIKEVGGRKLNSTDEAIAICEVFEKEIFKDRGAKEIDVILSRNGEDVHMNFNIPAFVPEKVSYTMCLQKASKR